MPSLIDICCKIALLVMAIHLYKHPFLLKIMSRADPSVAPDTNTNEEKFRKTNQPGSDHPITILIYDHLRLNININEEKSMNTNQPGSDHPIKPYINFTEEESLKLNQLGPYHIWSDIDINIKIMEHRYNELKYTCKYKCNLDLWDLNSFAGCIFYFLPKYIGACKDVMSLAPIIYIAVASIIVTIALLNNDLLYAEENHLYIIYAFIMFLILVLLEHLFICNEN